MCTAIFVDQIKIQPILDFCIYVKLTKWLRTIHLLLSYQVTTVPV